MDRATGVVDAAVAMADRGTLLLADNARLAAAVSRAARMSGIDVEAMMGRLAGGEDGWTIEARAGRGRAVAAR